MLWFFFYSSRICSAEDYFFQSRKEDNLATRVSFSDSITINLGNSVISFSELDWDSFCLYLPYFFFAGLMLQYPPWSSTSVVNLPKRIPICLIWREEFWAPANFSLSVTKTECLELKVVKILFLSKWLTLSYHLLK